MPRSPEAVARAKRNYLLRHPERRKASVRKYYEANKERLIAKSRKWEDDNREKFLERRRAYRRGNAKEIESVRRWQERNPEKVRAYKATVRAKRRCAEGRITPGHIEALLALQLGRCAACQVRLDGYHVDHIIPIARGGRNDDANIQLLCRPCNQSKNQRDPIEFMQSRGKLL